MVLFINLCMSGMVFFGEIFLSDSFFDFVYFMLVFVRRKELLNGIIEYLFFIYFIFINKIFCFLIYKLKLMVFFYVFYYLNFFIFLFVLYGLIFLLIIFFYFFYYL